jgi:hypothetical protein
MSTRKEVFKRIGLSLALGLLFAWILAEATFAILRNNTDRAPQRIELVIPAGTADQIASGQAVPSIPTDMVFVVGDTLVVKNEDTASHQLGPIWVPAGTSASLNLDTANQYSYECSFAPNRSIGLDVRSRVTLTTRIIAILFAGIPTGAILAVYSFVAFPIKKANREG